jgi:hypothetical protein
VFILVPPWFTNHGPDFNCGIKDELAEPRCARAKEIAWLAQAGRTVVTPDHHSRESLNEYMKPRTPFWIDDFVCIKKD